MVEIPKTPVATKFTLREFVAAGRERLKLSVVVDAGLDHLVAEPMMYRPGLALTGFFGNFAHKRIQVVGKAERAYLTSLGKAERMERLKALFDHGAYCIVFAAGMNVSDEIKDIAWQAGGTILASPLLTRNLIHASTFVLETLSAPTVRLYATTVEVAGLGVMMRGDPGVGKSETAMGLIKRGNALVADDFTCLRKDVIFGVTAVRAEKQLDLLVTFRRMEDVSGELDRVGDEWRTIEILGVPVPEIVIPVSVGRDLVNLVEIAAQQFKLRTAGYDPVAALDEQLKRRALS